MTDAQHTCIKDDGGTPNRKCYACELESRRQQPVMTLMFDARIQDMAKQLKEMEPGELDRNGLQALHEQTCRLLHRSLPEEN